MLTLIYRRNTLDKNITRPDEFAPPLYIRSEQISSRDAVPLANAAAAIAFYLPEVLVRCLVDKPGDFVIKNNASLPRVAAEAGPTTSQSIIVRSKFDLPFTKALRIKSADLAGLRWRVGGIEDALAARLDQTSHQLVDANNGLRRLSQAALAEANAQVKGRPVSLEKLTTAVVATGNAALRVLQEQLELQTPPELAVGPHYKYAKLPR